MMGHVILLSQVKVGDTISFLKTQETMAMEHKVAHIFLLSSPHYILIQSEKGEQLWGFNDQDVLRKIEEVG